MKNISKFKVDLSILIPILLFFIISIISIYSTRKLLSTDFSNLYIKQIIWYSLGIILAFTMMALGNKFLYNNAYIFYLIGIISLVLVLFFGVTVKIINDFEELIRQDLGKKTNLLMRWILT